MERGKKSSGVRGQEREGKLKIDMGVDDGTVNLFSISAFGACGLHPYRSPSFYLPSRQVLCAAVDESIRGGSDHSGRERTSIRIKWIQYQADRELSEGDSVRPRSERMNLPGIVRGQASRIRSTPKQNQ